MENVILFSNGDFRDPVGRNCWPKQEETLSAVEQSFSRLGVSTTRGNPFRPEKDHGFITTQAEAAHYFRDIPADAPIVLVMSSWVWAHHLAGCAKLHGGPVLLLANFDGTWPGLVSLLNHAGTYERLGIPYSRMWTDGFVDDERFMTELQEWINTGKVERPVPLGEPDLQKLPEAAARIGVLVAVETRRSKRILGQMDPGCMGMLNAVISPDALAGIGMPLELLNQSDLLAEMGLVDQADAEAALGWLEDAGVSFHWGSSDATDLTRSQVLDQMRMYVAAGRIAERYGLAAIGIPYQYGLVRCTAASDLAEGMLNNSIRPPITGTDGVIRDGRPIVHFNEGDVGSGVPQVLMHDILTNLGLPLETTLHDVRWGAEYEGRFLWTLEISGGAPPAHLGGWDQTHVYRQPAMYFAKGGGSCSGVSRPGGITWARFYESYGDIGLDVGVGEVVDLPDDEVDRRLGATTAEWPIANVAIDGYSRDELMANHKSNHITICYGDISAELCAAAVELGIPVRLAGEAAQRYGR